MCIWETVKFDFCLTSQYNAGEKHLYSTKDISWKSLNNIDDKIKILYNSNSFEILQVLIKNNYRLEFWLKVDFTKSGSEITQLAPKHFENNIKFFYGKNTEINNGIKLLD